MFKDLSLWQPFHTQMTVVLEFAEIPHELYPVSEFFNDSDSVAFYMLAGLLCLIHLNSRAEQRG